MHSLNAFAVVHPVTAPGALRRGKQSRVLIVMQSAYRYSGRPCKFAYAPSTPSWCSFGHDFHFKAYNLTPREIQAISVV